MQTGSKNKKSEHGGSGLNLLLTLAALILFAHAGYQFIPVAYDAENFKQEMQAAVVHAVALPNPGQSPVELVRGRLKRAAPSFHLPPDASIDVKILNGLLTARVVYSKPVSLLPFGLYVYQFQFDHTATPTGFLTRG